MASPAVQLAKAARPRRVVARVARDAEQLRAIGRQMTRLVEAPLAAVGERF